MRLASHFQIDPRTSLHEIAKSVSHREFRTWIAWLDEQLNEPDRTDYYLMQIAGHVEHVLSSKTSWKLDRYKIPFKKVTPTQTENEKDTKLKQSKSRWNSRLDKSRKRTQYGRRS